MSFGQRFKELRKFLNLSQIELAEILEVSQSTVSFYEKDEVYPSVASLFIIKNQYNVDLNWLFTGKGKMFIQEKQASTGITLNYSNSPLQPYTTGEFREVKIQGEISAGEPAFNCPYYEGGSVYISQDFLSDIANTFCFRVSGNSMKPDILNGDVVFIQPNTDWKLLEDKIIAVRTIDGITLKRLVVNHELKQAFLLPINNEYKPIIPTNDDNIIGNLILIVRTFPDCKV
jgi:SOS-response transcriptional repressor LexA